MIRWKDHFKVVYQEMRGELKGSLYWYKRTIKDEEKIIELRKLLGKLIPIILDMKKIIDGEHNKNRR